MNAVGQVNVCGVQRKITGILKKQHASGDVANEFIVGCADEVKYWQMARCIFSYAVMPSIKYTENDVKGIDFF